jgi:putative transposase
MTAVESVDGAGVLRQLLAEGQPDVLRTMVAAFANALMSVEADGLCGAEYGQRSEDRVNRRNGYRTRSGAKSGPTIPSSG